MDADEAVALSPLTTCIEVLQNSTNDSQRLAALLVAVNLKDVLFEDVVRLFNAIGTGFLLRLFKNKKENSKETTMLGLQILKTFARASTLHDDPNFVDFLRRLSPVLRDDVLAERQTLDCFIIVVRNVASTPVGRRALLTGGYVGKLWKLITSSSATVDVDPVLTDLIRVCLVVDDDDAREATNFALTLIAQSVCNVQSADKFFRLSRFNALLDGLDDAVVASTDELEWIHPSSVIVKDVVTSRTTVNQMELAISLAAHLCRSRRHRWISDYELSLTKSQFFCILLKRVCLESQIIFDDDSPDAAEKLVAKKALLASCCRVVETLVAEGVAEEVIGESKEIAVDHTTGIKLSLIALFGAITTFLDAWAPSFCDRVANDEATEDEVVALLVVARFYGYLSRDPELSQTEEFARGSSALLAVENAFVEDERRPKNPSILQLLAPGIIELSGDVEFFDEVSKDVCPKLMKTTSNDFDVVVYDVCMNLCEMYPQKTLPLELFSTLNHHLVECIDIPSETSVSKRCYRCALGLKLVVMTPCHIRNTASFSKFLGEAHRCIKDKIFLKREGDSDIVEELAITCLDSLNKLRDFTDKRTRDSILEMFNLLTLQRSQFVLKDVS